MPTTDVMSSALATQLSSRVTPPDTCHFHVFLDVNNLIPVVLYDVDTAERIMSMATNEDEPSHPFLQRIQLVGPNKYKVQAMGQVDDGAMWNCISQK